MGPGVLWEVRQGPPMWKFVLHCRDGGAGQGNGLKSVLKTMNYVCRLGSSVFQQMWQSVWRWGRMKAE